MNDFGPSRPNSVYQQDIMASLLAQGWELGDRFRLVHRYYDAAATTCEMCGGKVNRVRDVFVLMNTRTMKTMNVGCLCVKNYQEVMSRMELDGTIKYIPDTRKAAFHLQKNGVDIEEENARGVPERPFRPPGVTGAMEDEEDEDYAFMAAGMEEDEDEDEDEELLDDLGLDPDGDYMGLAPHGMRADGEDDEELDDEDMIAIEDEADDDMEDGDDYDDDDMDDDDDYDDMDD